MNLITVDARDRFLNKLKGITEPEEKKKNHRGGRIYPSI